MPGHLRSTATPASLAVLAGHWRPAARRVLGMHRNAGLEIVVVRRGHLRWQVDGQVEAVPPGSAFFTMPWQEHGGVDADQPGCDLSFVILPIHGGRRGPWTLPDGGGGAALAALAACRRHTWTATPLLQELIPALADGVEAGTAGSRRDALGRAAVEEMASIVAGGAHAAEDPALIRVRTLVEALERRCAEPWNLTTLAAEAGLARTRFAELVLQATGDSPHRLLNRLRVRRLQRLLRASRRSVTDLALDCGFAGGSHGARVFRIFTGISPAEWRAGTPWPAR